MSPSLEMKQQLSGIAKIKMHTATSHQAARSWIRGGKGVAWGGGGSVLLLTPAQEAYLSQSFPLSQGEAS